MRHLPQLLVLLLTIHSPLYAEELFRWQDERGHTYYGDNLPDNAANARGLSLQYQPSLYEVTKVIDGDTIRVKNGGKVRLLGINAPEIPRRDHQGEALGEAAHHRLEQLLKNKKVRLEFDTKKHDRFERLLAHVILEDGTNINELLLQEGLARTLFLQPNLQYLHRYHRIELAAQRGRRGIWSLPQYQVLPARKASTCNKRFCRLRGTVRQVVRDRHYTDIFFTDNLHIAIHNSLLSQFQAAGITADTLQDQKIIVSGRFGRRNGTPYLRLQHPLQITSPQAE